MGRRFTHTTDMGDEDRLDYTPPPPSARNTAKKRRGDAKDAVGDAVGGGGGRGGRDLRRAYYRKSLQWHPDRWAGMPALYLPAVQVPYTQAQIYT